MLNCSRCGEKNTDDSRFCKACGNGVPSEVAPAADAMGTIGPIAAQERVTKFLDMAFYHNRVGNTSGAIKACESALAINPRSTTAHSLLGSLFEKTGDTDAAIAQFAAVLALNPESVADAVKLQELQNGIHSPARSEERAASWPASSRSRSLFAGIAAFDWGTMRDRKVAGVPLVPAVIAGVILLLALAIGASSVHGPAPALPGSHVTVVANRPTITQPPLLPQLPPPGRSGPFGLTTGAAPSHNPVNAYAQDPFTQRTTELRGSRVAIGSREVLNNYDRPSRSFSSALPPPQLPSLNLRALPPIASNVVPPAPVNVQSVGNTAQIPRHTVVVSSLNSANGAFGPPPPSEFAQAPGDQQTNSDSTSAGGVAQPSHIQISVDSSGESHSGSAQSERSTGTLEVGASTSGQEASSYQQSALGLQQDGEYKKAASLYAKAIRLYKAAVRNGTDAESAARGLQACETGLQICQQSQ